MHLRTAVQNKLQLLKFRDSWMIEQIYPVVGQVSLDNGSVMLYNNKSICGE